MVCDCGQALALLATVVCLRPRGRFRRTAKLPVAGAGFYPMPDGFLTEAPVPAQLNGGAFR